MISANATELLASWIVPGGVCGDGCKSLQKGYTLWFQIDAVCFTHSYLFMIGFAIRNSTAINVFRIDIIGTFALCFQK
jgi:hypothetical protein